LQRGREKVEKLGRKRENSIGEEKKRSEGNGSMIKGNTKVLWEEPGANLPAEAGKE